MSTEQSKPLGLNAWIDAQVKFNFDGLDQDSQDQIGEIARGAVLQTIANKAALIDNLVNAGHAANVSAGWWTDLHTGEDLHGKRNIGELLCLVHSEISEAIEGRGDIMQRMTHALVLFSQAMALEAKRGEDLLQLHAAISQAMEGHRKSKMDDKLPHRPMFRVELIDAMIRIFDILGSDNREHPAGSIFVEKDSYNAKRADHKPENRRLAGGKAF